ncbi:acetyl esterase/lipase [Pacificibacter maritimus]|uniref:Acetyl esterase/lipase n=1 Tax=Pacificibacter maritimus TaxID=762213 RepID=A0A3N4UJ21_9RHOB|nr:alpha/beta hydrolase [Pacificibacter maritimus]RPE67269.1 acetyl esterase/lipase [Pacificibacter maritimus]
MLFRRRDVLNFWLRTVEKRKLAWLPTVQVQRQNFELQAMGFPREWGLKDETIEIGGVACRKLTPKGARGELLYLHGGAYIMGSPSTHCALAGTIAARAKLQVILPDYRLAPEHPFPAAFNDCLSVAKALSSVSDGLIIGGDSAGGGLTLAVLSDLCRHDMSPLAAFAFSPWTDLSFTGRSLTTNAQTDAILPVERIYEVRKHYLQSADPTDHRASPLFAPFKNAPPVFLQWSDSEILADDGRRMVASLQAQNVDVEAKEWHDLPHVWQLFHDRLNEADEALADLYAFLDAQFEALEITR